MQKIFIILSLIIISFNGLALIPDYKEDLFERNLMDDMVIYGDDNTFSVHEYADMRFVLASQAVAIMISSNQIEDYGNYLELKRKKNERNGLPFCKEETKFENRIYSKCSGFLVDENVLVTASHCVPSTDACRNGHKWIFGFRAENIGLDGEVFVSHDDSYTCKRIIESGSIFTSFIQNDYAVIELDRKVEGIEPIKKIRKTGKIEKDAELVLIGYPAGRPQVITDNGIITDNSFFYFFKTNLDSFKGNSGAPVFNRLTAEVEGIFLGGETDFELNQEDQCWNVKRCGPESNCKGEDVFRITGIDYLSPGKYSWLRFLMEGF